MSTLNFDTWGYWNVNLGYMEQQQLEVQLEFFPLAPTSLLLYSENTYWIP